MARKYDVYTSSQPPDPTSAKLWQDTSTNPPVLKRYDGAVWVSVGTKGDTGATGAKGDTGATGPPGPRGLTWRGAWVSTTAYAADDGVSHDGSGWIALRANTGVTPVEGADWTILAQRGASGTAATTAALGTVRVSTAPAAGTDPTAVETGDARVPTQGENDALTGTSGTPSGTNRYVTNTDTRLSDARTPTAHAASHAPGGADALAVDAAPATGSLRTLGTGSTQAAAGNDPRFAKEAIGAFRAHNGADQLDIASDTSVKVLFPTEEYDAAGWYDAATSTYTPQRAGRYLLAAHVQISPSVSGKSFFVRINKNGAIHAFLSITHTSHTGNVAGGGATEVNANGTTDHFEVFLFHTFGVNTSDLGGSSLPPSRVWFAGHYLGA